jgi:hypothetical protein
MSDPFWAYLETLPGKSAALFDWDKALSGWDRYPLFRDNFLQLTKNHATAVDCPTECGLGCPRSVITHAKTDIRAVCIEKEHAAIQLSPRQTLIYRLKQSAINGAICTAPWELNTERQNSMACPTHGDWAISYPRPGWTSPLC